MYIRVDNKREGSSVDLVDTIFVDVTLSPNSSLPAKVYNGDFGNGNIELGFRARAQRTTMRTIALSTAFLEAHIITVRPMG